MLRARSALGGTVRACILALLVVTMPALGADFTRLTIVGKECIAGKAYSVGPLDIRIFEASKAQALLRLASEFDTVSRRGDDAEIGRLDASFKRLYDAARHAPVLAEARRQSNDSSVALVPKHKQIVIFGFTMSGEDDVGVVRTMVVAAKDRQDVVLNYTDVECPSSR